MPDNPSEKARLAAVIDHTQLKPDAGARDIDRLCDEALEHGFFAVCVQGVHVERCARRLAGTPVIVASVAGFPLGGALPEVKAFEARCALGRGATEIDMVVDVGALVDGDLDAVRRDVEAVAEVCQRAGGLLKTILEVGLLERATIVAGARAAVGGGADLVKTSTGFAGSGARVEDVALLREALGPEVGIKAAGGVRDGKSALALLDAGATRIGSSASVAILGPESPPRTPS